jgi:hypothetical protein
VRDRSCNVRGRRMIKPMRTRPPTATRMTRAICPSAEAAPGGALASPNVAIHARTAKAVPGRIIRSSQNDDVRPKLARAITMAYQAPMRPPRTAHVIGAVSNGCRKQERGTRSGHAFSTRP